MLGLGLALPLRASLGAGGFTPASLFGGSDVGAAFDLSGTSGLYQTADTSTPVTTNGQSIGRVNDISGKGNHATQATAGFRPTYQGYGQFDGTDDTLVTAALNFSATDKVTVIASLRTDAAAQHFVVNLGGGVGSASLVVFAANYSRGVISGTTVVDTTGPTLSTNTVVTLLLDIAGATATDEIKVRKDGALPAQSVNAPGPVTGNFGAALPISLSSNSAAAYLNGRIYRAIIIGRVLSGAELTNAERWVGAPAGVII